MSVVGVTFGDNNKIYHFYNKVDKVDIDDFVVVDTDRGAQVGKITKTNIENIDSRGLKKVLRIATSDDIKINKQNEKDSEKAFNQCVELIKEYKLNMRLIEANYSFDRKLLLFTYVSEERVDFRDLVKELASIFHTRIELRQVGVRDKAKEIGGIGPCGRELCCTKFLKEFDSVSINQAKNQNLALNPTKISGACGRLMCCLRYENELYKELKKEMPKLGDIVKTKNGKGKVISLDVISGKYLVRISDNETVEVKIGEKDGSN